MDENGLSLTHALKAAELAKSSWHYRPTPRRPRSLNPKRVAAIEAAWPGTRGVYGYRKVYKTLRAGGLRANKKAVLRHLRVDRGSQFVARRFREAAKALGVILEYAGIQCSEDKPYIESFFGHYKVEEVYRNAYVSLAEGQVGWRLYRVWYEAERIRQSLGYRTPQAVRHGALDLVLSKAQNGTV